MNFFAHQDKARSQTTLLVGLFSVSVLVLILLTEVLFIAVYASSQGLTWQEMQSAEALRQHIGFDNLFYIAVAIVSVVGLAALYKKAQLSSGGEAIAEAMNGRLLNINTRNPDEKKVLNVVEEMAIASGTPVPPVYLIEDYSINAFAAGYSPSDAVIGITRGSIQLLDRDELQGVIAHEFSHIFNGDMRLNIRLISTLHGILVIGMLGYFLMRVSMGSRYYGSGYRSSSSRDNQGAVPIALIGLGLVIIGYTGTFFGNLIKAAVSRQREFLADASAVQFTRNPQGIGNALKKIGGYSLGSRMDAPEAEQISHMLFGQGVSSHFSGFLATHPPLDNRIKRIEPRWKGNYPSVALPEAVKANPSAIKVTNKGPVADNAALAMAAAATTSALDSVSTGTATANNTETGSKPAATVMESIGEPTDAHLKEAQKILTSIPESLKEAAHEPFGSRALVYCLLLDREQEKVRSKQLKQLQMYADPAVYSVTLKLQQDVERLHKTCQLPLLDLCLPALKQLGKEPLKIFKSNMLKLIKADYKVELFEWSLYRIVMHTLEPPKTSGKCVSIKAVREDCQRLLSAVALSSTDDLKQAEQRYTQAWDSLDIHPALPFIEDALEDTSLLDRSLKRANYIYPLKKPRLIKACCLCLQGDNSQEHDHAESIELIRAIGNGLDTPIPPMLSGQTFT